jgi:hypothetical protein
VKSIGFRAATPTRRPWTRTEVPKKLPLKICRRSDLLVPVPPASDTNKNVCRALRVEACDVLVDIRCADHRQVVIDAEINSLPEVARPAVARDEFLLLNVPAKYVGRTDIVPARARPVRVDDRCLAIQCQTETKHVFGVTSLGVSLVQAAVRPDPRAKNQTAPGSPYPTEVTAAVAPSSATPSSVHSPSVVISHNLQGTILKWSPPRVQSTCDFHAT